MLRWIFVIQIFQCKSESTGGKGNNRGVDILKEKRNVTPRFYRCSSNITPKGETFTIDEKKRNCDDRKKDIRKKQKYQVILLKNRYEYQNQDKPKQVPDNGKQVNFQRHVRTKLSPFLLVCVKSRAPFNSIERSSLTCEKRTFISDALSYGYPGTATVPKVVMRADSAVKPVALALVERMILWLDTG